MLDGRISCVGNVLEAVMIRGLTYTGIVNEDIEAPILSSEGVDRGFDGGEVGQVKAQKVEAAIALGRCLFDNRHGLLGFGCGAACNPNSRIVGIENIA